MKLLNLLMENDNGFNLKVGSTDKFDVYLTDGSGITKIYQNMDHYIDSDNFFFYLKPISKQLIYKIKYIFIHYGELGFEEMLVVKLFPTGETKDFATWELLNHYTYHLHYYKGEIASQKDMINIFEVIKSFLATKSDDMLSNIL